jgi:hypothetical protein
VVNLTTVSTFDEFVEQVRHDRLSQVVLMPHHREPLPWRQLQSFGEILTLYPDFAEDRRNWTQRVFVKIDERGLKPLSFFWKRGGPRWVRAANWTLSALGSARMRPVFKLVQPRKDLLPTSFTNVLPANNDEDTVLPSFSSDTV